MKKSTQSQMHNEATVHCFNMSLNTFKFNPFRHIGCKKKNKQHHKRLSHKFRQNELLLSYPIPFFMLNRLLINLSGTMKFATQCH